VSLWPLAKRVIVEVVVVIGASLDLPLLQNLVLACRTTRRGSNSS